MNIRTAVSSRPLAWLRLASLGLLIGALALVAGAARAQHAPNEEADPPGRVGRIADVQGRAWVWTPEAGDWTAAERNAVLTTGDRISTENGARAEVRVGSTIVRLDANTEVEVARLDDQRIDLRLHDGSAAIRLRNREQLGEVAVLTNEGRFSFQRVGRYRVDRGDDTSHLTVDSGQGLYEGPRSALTVQAGQRAEFWLDTAGVAQYAITDPQRDAFAAWLGERDRYEDRVAVTPYVSPEMTGAEELDRHGTWQQTPDYGALWVPQHVSPGWTPYSTGRWAWVRPWGWTWIDEAPWGFAPFHYGRWVHWRGHWAWAPGVRVLRPVYAPALVAWIGGPHFGLSINIGGGGPVGWFPLAPREVWVPWYRTSPVYVRQVNVTHITNVTVIDNAYRRPPSPYDLRYRKFPHAVTVVPADVVTRRQSVTVARLRDDDVVRQVVERRPAPGTNAFAPPVAAPVVAPRTAAPVIPRAPGRVLPNERRDGDRPTARVERPERSVVVPPRTSVRPDADDRPPRTAGEPPRNSLVEPPGNAVGQAPPRVVGQPPVERTPRVGPPQNDRPRVGEPQNDRPRVGEPPVQRRVAPEPSSDDRRRVGEPGERPRLGASLAPQRVDRDVEPVRLTREPQGRPAPEVRRAEAPAPRRVEVPQPRRAEMPLPRAAEPQARRAEQPLREARRQSPAPERRAETRNRAEP